MEQQAIENKRNIKHGWTIEQALFIPVKVYLSTNKLT